MDNRNQQDKQKINQDDRDHQKGDHKHAGTQQDNMQKNAGKDQNNQNKNQQQKH